MTEQTNDQFDLNSLDDQELTEQVHDDLYNGLKEEVETATHIFLKRGWNAERVLNDALVEGMRIVGIDFRDGILFVPEVLLAANAMKGGMEILRPLLAETGVEPIGKVVIGTVKGDIHDIGKNLVSMMLEGAGFEVVDLGINNPVEKYLQALETHKPDILGMSALLTTTMPYMKVVIDTLKEKGMRNDYIILVGGAPLNEEFGKAVGADAYCRDAADCGGNRQDTDRHAPCGASATLKARQDCGHGRAGGSQPLVSTPGRLSSAAVPWRGRSRRCARANGWARAGCTLSGMPNCTIGLKRITEAVRSVDSAVSRRLSVRSWLPMAIAAPAGRLDAMLQQGGGGTPARRPLL